MDVAIKRKIIGLHCFRSILVTVTQAQYTQGRSQPPRCGGAEQRFLPKTGVRF